MQQPQPQSQSQVHFQYKNYASHSDEQKTLPPMHPSSISRSSVHSDPAQPTPLYRHLPHLEHSRGSMPSPPTDEFRPNSPQRPAVMARPSYTAPMPIFPASKEQSANYNAIYHGPDRLSPVAYHSNTPCSPLARDMQTIPAVRHHHHHHHQQHQQHHDSNYKYSPRMPIPSPQRLHHSQQSHHEHFNGQRSHLDLSVHHLSRMPHSQFHTPESPLPLRAHSSMQHGHQQHQQQQQQQQQQQRPPMISIVRSSTHGHPLYHQSQRLGAPAAPITPTTPVSAGIKKSVTVPVTAAARNERVSYVNSNASSHTPNHSGNIVFSVGIGNYGRSGNGSTASKSSGAPPANTMASQISKFRATRRIVDKRDHQRRVSHSAIERRRRERINSEIGHLRRLVPSCRGQDHLHKLSVLQGAIAYIHELRRQLGVKDEASDLDPTLNAHSQESNPEGEMDASDGEHEETTPTSSSPVDSTSLSNGLGCVASNATEAVHQHDEQLASIKKEQNERDAVNDNRRSASLERILN